MRLMRFLGGCLLALLPTALHAQTAPVPALSNWQANWGIQGYTEQTSPWLGCMQSGLAVYRSYVLNNDRRIPGY